MSLTDSELLELEQLVELQDIDAARNHLWDFTRYNFDNLDETQFHKNYYEILQAFAEGKIKRLMVSISPQHGKTLGSSEMLPSFLLGRDGNKKIVISSYSTTQARKFNRKIQRIIDDPRYVNIFPNTKLNGSNFVTVSTNSLRNADEFEIVGQDGSLKVVGRGGALTGNPVDIMIMDDMYKDAQEANSPLIRDNVWDYYMSVVKTRLHNDSQELIVFTRWHEDDLIGRLCKKESVIEITSLDDLEDVDPMQWVKINFEAIKTGDPTDIDPRKEGDPLYPSKHSLKKLIETRDLDKERFNCLYQGDPQSKEGLLYSPFTTYETLPTLFDRKNYTDTADTGIDYLCSVSYGVSGGNYYVLDILYTPKPMEHTEVELPKQLIENKIRKADIESNNGGRGFAREIQKSLQGHCAVSWFHQSKNKEARIITNSSLVTKHIIMPIGWEKRWPDFHSHLVYFKKVFRSNKQDGAPDVLTGIIERNRSSGIAIM
jgi:predicted phage terminase large subunit-like protein